MTLFIDVDPEKCFERIKKSRNNFEMYEKIDIMRKVRSNYLKAFEVLKGIEKIAVIDGNNTIKAVETEVLHEIKKIFKME